MIYLISYVVISLLIAFLGVAWNEAKYKDPYKRSDANYDVLGLSMFWPFAITVLLVVAPFWAIISLAKWFGRNYL